MELLTEVAVAVLAGFLSHVCYFVRGEHHLEAPTYTRIYLVLAAIGYLFQWKAHGFENSKAFAVNSLVVSAYAGSLFTSMIIYRLFFHRLRSFPGPLMASISKLYHLWNIRNFDQYRFMDRMHSQYGDFVRTGPNEITIFTPEAVAPIYGPESRCSKSPWYDMMQPLCSMMTTRSRAIHDARRRVWDMGFSMKALREHEHRVLSHVQELDTKLASFGNEPVNITKWFEYFTFDTMGEISFGLSWDTMKSEESRIAIDMYQEGSMVLGPATPVPWLFHILFSIPGLQKGWRKYRSWADNQLRLRIKRQPDFSDSISWMVNDAEEQGGVEEHFKWLLGDFLLNIAGGSETILSTLVFLFYNLAQHPHEVEKLRTELKGIDDLSNNKALQLLPHLNGLINETLRLHPPVLANASRDTPPEGLMIDGKYISGNVTVLIPQYTLHRRDDCYEKPNEFIPERWYSKPKMIKDKRAFIPFGAGNYKCIGKNLGLMELRIATAVLVTNYDIALAPNEDGTKLFKELRDTFTTAPGPLNLVFHRKAK